MSFDYSITAESAKRILTRFGQTVVLNHRSAGSYNPATGSALITTTSESGVGAEFDYGTKDIDGTLIKAGDKQLFLSPVDITVPQVNDTVTIGDDTYTITRVKNLKPAGVSVLIECNLRK